MLYWIVRGGDGVYHLELLRLERYVTGSLIEVIMVMNSRAISLSMFFLLVSRGIKMGMLMLRSLSLWVMLVTLSTLIGVTM